MYRDIYFFHFRKGSIRRETALTCALAPHQIYEYLLCSLIGNSAATATLPALPEIHSGFSGKCTSLLMWICTFLWHCLGEGAGRVFPVIYARFQPFIVPDNRRTMINIVIESGGCHSDIFEGRGEVAGVALMWLFPSTPPPPPAAWSAWYQPLPPLACLFQASQDHLLCCNRGGMDGGEGVHPSGSLYCRGSQALEWMDAQRPHVPVLQQCLLNLSSDQHGNTVHTAAARQSRPREERQGYRNMVYKGFLSILQFPFLLPHSSMINTTVKELQRVMKTMGLGCIGEPIKFSLQAHPK